MCVPRVVCRCGPRALRGVQSPQKLPWARMMEWKSDSEDDKDAYASSSSDNEDDDDYEKIRQMLRFRQNQIGKEESRSTRA